MKRLSDNLLAPEEELIEHLNFKNKVSEFEREFGTENVIETK